MLQYERKPIAEDDPQHMLFGFTLGLASRLWDEGMVGDEWKEAVERAALTFLRETLGQPDAKVRVEWFGQDVVNVHIVERSAIDRLADLSN